jgi:hypothetical protein
MSNITTKKDEAELDEELEDTFPASDPPSITSPQAGITGGKPEKPAERPETSG